MATQQPSASPVFSYTAPALLSPPRAFGIVERGVYRSNAPDHPSQLVFLRSIGLRSIVLLSPEAPTRSLLEYLDENKIALTHLGMTAWKSNLGWKPVSEELIKEGIERVLDVRNHPIMVMCSSGIHETGSFIGCLRKLQGWNFNSIVVEYRFFAGSKSRCVNEQFIELFDTDLISLPRHLPEWFVDAQTVLAEEEAEYEAMRS